jgi:hypothetical protein
MLRGSIAEERGNMLAGLNTLVAEVRTSHEMAAGDPAPPWRGSILYFSQTKSRHSCIIPEMAAFLPCTWLNFVLAHLDPLKVPAP